MSDSGRLLPPIYMPNALEQQKLLADVQSSYLDTAKKARDATALRQWGGAAARGEQAGETNLLAYSPETANIFANVGQAKANTRQQIEVTQREVLAAFAQEASQLPDAGQRLSLFHQRLSQAQDRGVVTRAQADSLRSQVTQNPALIDHIISGQSYAGMPPHQTPEAQAKQQLLQEEMRKRIETHRQTMEPPVTVTDPVTREPILVPRTTQPGAPHAAPGYGLPTGGPIGGPLFNPSGTRSGPPERGGSSTPPYTARGVGAPDPSPLTGPMPGASSRRPTGAAPGSGPPAGTTPMSETTPDEAGAAARTLAGGMTGAPIAPVPTPAPPATSGPGFPNPPPPNAPGIVQPMGTAPGPSPVIPGAPVPPAALGPPGGASGPPGTTPAPTMPARPSGPPGPSSFNVPPGPSPLAAMAAPSDIIDVKALSGSSVPAGAMDAGAGGDVPSVAPPPTVTAAAGAGGPRTAPAPSPVEHVASRKIDIKDVPFVEPTDAQVREATRDRIGDQGLPHPLRVRPKSEAEKQQDLKSSDDYQRILKASEGSGDVIAQLNTLDNILDTDITTGKTAPYRLAITSLGTELGKIFGVPTPEFERHAKLLREFEVAGRNLGFDRVNALGSREAMQVVDQVMRTKPSIEHTPMENRGIIAMLRMAAQRTIDKREFYEKYAAKNRGSYHGAESLFEKLYPVEAYSSRVVPERPPVNTKNAIKDVIYDTREYKGSNGHYGRWDGKEYDPVPKGMFKHFDE